MSKDQVTRRTMLKMAGGATLGLGGTSRILAVFADGSIVRQDHRVPSDKKLSAAWRKSLTARGKKEVWSGDALKNIGMPIGGIAAGQVYLDGYGRISTCEVFNHHEFYGYGATNYIKQAHRHDIDLSFHLILDDKETELGTGETQTFRGEFPIAEVDFGLQGSPIRARMTAYSPFVPLNAKDSALPVTLFEIELHNTSSKSVAVALEGRLGNPVGRRASVQRELPVQHSALVTEPSMTAIIHTAEGVKDEFAEDSANPRPPILLADFEGSYGDWKPEGEALGTAPAKGTLPDQQDVRGFDGQGLVNTYLKGDATTGKLVSPPLTLLRKFVNFKIGGGNHPGKTCINLVVDGKVVRTSTGLNDERLLWDAWNVEDFAGKTARIEIVDEDSGGWGHINVDHVEMADAVRSREDLHRRHGSTNPDIGTIALALLEKGGTQLDTTHDEKGLELNLGKVRSRHYDIPPGKKSVLTFVLAWHFPEHPRGRQYANWFKDAKDVVRYVQTNFARLSHDTKLWRETYYDSTLPYWLLDRLHSTIGNLATGTTEWWGDGRFWAWEGVVCCSGTCTHVWNYEHGLARLFPVIERNIRERQDFGEGYDEATGLVGFRSNRDYAADGQCGTVLKAYREHLCSKDGEFLKANWPKVKKILGYLITRDANGDGLLEDSQPNTYDIDFFGANTFVGSLYLAALRAGEEMATEQGDTSFASQCRALFEKGSKASVDRLWKDDYFVQDVDEAKVKEFQYGPGCLSDQLFGQGWAHQVGLGHIYPREKVVQALKSVWKYNWAPDVKGQNERWKPERPFAVHGEAGLFICTWPNGGRQQEPVRYRDEVWTGIEYQVAGNMVWDGLVEEGLSICKAIHERYHPAKRNPYNEIECSDHYARALASWGVFTALSGFTYHGPKGQIGFAPRVTPDNFRSAFTAAEGWGTFSQTVASGKQTDTIKLLHGTLSLNEISLDTKVKGSVEAFVRGAPHAVEATRDGSTIKVRLKTAVKLVAGEAVEVRIG
ncbi:MAG: hypothetical protein JSS66_08045 [Armatimonadetes bacterium]|nr:hypothetical protein [Armatimonadota bacterium]